MKKNEHMSIEISKTDIIKCVKAYYKLPEDMLLSFSVMPNLSEYGKYDIAIYGTYENSITE